MANYSNKDILKAFKEINRRIDDLWCYIKECCAKVPRNIGNGEGIYKMFYNDKWQFKSLLAGDNISITSQDDTITITSTVEPIDCEDINDCLGISEEGQPNKFLNEQGDWETISLTGTPNRFLYYDNLGNIDTNQAFVAEPSQTFIGNIVLGGYYYSDGFISELGYSTNADNNSPDAYFRVSPSNITYQVPLAGGDQFILPIYDGNPGDVMTTDGNGSLTLQPIPAGFTCSDLIGCNISNLTNDSGYITSSALSPYLTSTTAALTYEPLLGFTPENVSNKTDVMSGNTTSSTKYLSVKGVYDWVISLGYITSSALTGYLTSATAAATYQVILSAANFGAFINGLSAKTTPADADGVVLMDGADSNNAKFLSWANIKATLKTYFDSIYYAANARITIPSNLTTTSSSAADMTGIVTPTLDANSTYYFRGVFSVLSQAGGVKFAMTVPSGATGVVFATGRTTFLAAAQAAFGESGALSLTALATFANSGTDAIITGSITTSSTPGVVQFRWASGVGGQLSTVVAERTYLEIIKKP